MRMCMVWMWLSIGLRSIMMCMHIIFSNVTHAAEKSDELRDVDGCDARGSLYDAQRGVCCVIPRFTDSRPKALVVIYITYFIFGFSLNNYSPSPQCTISSSHSHCSRSPSPPATNPACPSRPSTLDNTLMTWLNANLGCWIKPKVCEANTLLISAKGDKSFVGEI